MPAPLIGIHHIALICSDYIRAKHFYTQVLGARILAEHYRAERHSHKLDLCLPDGKQLELFSFPNPPPRRSYPEACGLRHLAFAVADLDAMIAHLQQHGIPVVHDLPGVGENLQDHLEMYLQYECKEPVSLYPALQWWNQPKIGAEWLFGGTGIGASNQFEAGGFIRSRAEFAWPNIQYHFLPVAINYNGSNAVKEHGFQCHVGSMRSPSRGHVRLKSRDPHAHPAILFNYMSHEQDWQEFRDAIRITREIMNQPALDKYRGREISPGIECQSDAELDEFVRNHAETAFHPCGTCKMGYDEMAVVDGEGRVHGLEGLRVVDASIMPQIITGNLNATTIMIGEKMADAIRGRQPLPRSTAAYYVAGDAPVRR